MRIFLVAALVLMIFALIVAAGGTFITSWPVWLTAAFVAWLIDQLFGGYIVVNTTRRAPPAA